MMGERNHVEAMERAPLLPTTSIPVVKERQRSRRRRCITWVGCVAVVLLASVALISFTLRHESKDFPPDGPGIGIALSSHYGTVAVRHDDGSIEHGGRVEAAQDYIAMLRRLSRPESQHPSPPYRSLSEAFSDRPRQWARSLRKKAGYPASTDVGLLAEMLRGLVAVAQERLPPSQRPLDSALVALPNAIALYPEDARDALEYLGLQALSGHNVYAVPRALPVAFAGYGQGLCADPGDFSSCLGEERQMPQQGVVAVDMSRTSLSVDSRWMDTPMYVFDERRAGLDWNTGLDEAEAGGEAYWELVRAQIESVMGALERTSTRPQDEPIIDKVLMIGDAADDERLTEVVYNAVSTFQHEKAAILLEQPQFVAARGAAELAKRLLIQRGRLT